MSSWREFDPGEERELRFQVPEDMLTEDEEEAAGSDPTTGRLIRAPEETVPLAFVGVREQELVAMPLSILKVWRRRRPVAELTVISSLPEAAFYALSAGLAERFVDLSDDPSQLSHALRPDVPALMLSEDPERQAVAAQEVLARAANQEEALVAVFCAPGALRVLASAARDWPQHVSLCAAVHGRDALDFGSLMLLESGASLIVGGGEEWQQYPDALRYITTVVNRSDEPEEHEAGQQALGYATLQAATRAVRTSLSGCPDRSGIARFFADACFAIGLTTLDPLDGSMNRGVGIIAADDDPALRSCFELRDRMSDHAFAAAWEVANMRWGVLRHPSKPKALIRFALQASLITPDRKVHRVRRAFLFDAAQMIEPLLQRFREPGTWAWVVPTSVATRETSQRRPESFYDTVSHCLPIGISAGEPIHAIDTALAHAREPWGR